MVNEVGTDRLFVRPIVRSCPEGMVITTGDQPGVAGVITGAAAGAFGFSAAQVAVEPEMAAPQE
jgi:hypothetical protein